jgi:transcriptional regulator with XRE-family HTH domain
MPEAVRWGKKLFDRGPRKEAPMILLRRLLGDVLRRQRQRQGRTLREVSASARVSLGYLSEVERGQKEASSELLSAICDALDVRMSEVMREVSDELSLAELAQSAAAETEAVSMRSMLEPVTHVPGSRVTINAATAKAVDVVAA